MNVSRLLLQAALFLVAGGWSLSASAAWDLTSNPDPITKPEGILDGHIYYFRNMCSPMAAGKAMGGDFSYSSGDITEKQLFRVVYGEINPLTGTQMIYLQNIENEKWFSGTTDGWTIETMEESTPLTLNLASKTTNIEWLNMSPMVVADWIAAGGDPNLTDAEIFPNENKYQAWKWKPDQLDDPDGDAITLGVYADDYTEGDNSKITFIKHNWGWDNYPYLRYEQGSTAINPFYAYEAVFFDDKITDLEVLINEYNNEDLVHMYRGGTLPGCVDQTLVDAFFAKYQEAQDAVSFENYDKLTPEVAEVLLTELKAARQALDKAEVVPMREGYYYVVNGCWGFEDQQKYTVLNPEDGTSTEVGKLKALYDLSSTTNRLRWADLYEEVKDAEGNTTGLIPTRDRYYMFYISPNKNNPDLWDIQNVKTGRYFQNGRTASTIEVGTPQYIEYKGYGVFGIRAEDGGSGDYAQAGGHKSGGGTSGEMTAWSIGGANDPGTWRFLEITEPELLDSIKGELTQNVLETALQIGIEEATARYDAGFEGYITDVNQLSSNATDPEEGSLANLIDGDPTTFFHSSWHSEVAPDEDHYLQVQLPEAVDGNIGIYWHKRTQNDNNRPIRITIMGSTNGTDWTEAGVLPAGEDTLPRGSSTPAYKGSVALNGSYSYLRFVVNMTSQSDGKVNTAINNGHPYFTFGEFQLYPGFNAADSTFEYAPNSIGYREDLRGSYETLKAAIDAAETKVGKATQDDIDAIQAVIDAFDAAYPDTTLLGDVIARAETYYAQATVNPGNGALGTYNTESIREALQTTATAARTVYCKPNVTRAEIDQHRTELLNAIDAFLGDINMPEANKWYVIVNKFNGEREGSNPTDLCVYSNGNDVGSGIVWGGTFYENAVNNPAYLWRFEDLGNGTYGVRNFGSGYYMGENRGQSAQYLLSDTVVPFKIVYIAGEQFSLQDALVSDDEPMRFIHAAAAGSAVVTWEASMNNPSCWNFTEMTEGDFYAQTALPANGMDIRCFPYVTGVSGQLSDLYGEPVIPYEVASATKNAEGKITEITLNPMDIPAGGIPAGTPYITMQGEDATGEGTVVVNFSIDLNGELSTEAKSVNGMVGVLRDVSVPAGCGYFVGDSHELSVIGGSGTTVGSQTGYIDPRLITEDNPAAEGSVVIKIADDGVLDAIKDAIKDANSIVTVISVDGVVVRQNVKAGEALKGLPKGVYIVGGKKVSVK